jgi:hypothetical protein
MSDHPDDRALRAWLETGKPARVARHLDDGCETCLDRLDSLSDLGDIRDELETVSAPPDGFQPRTTGNVQSRLAAEEAAIAFLELFTLPWRTASVLFDGATRREVDAPLPNGHDSDDDGEHADD